MRNISDLTEAQKETLRRLAFTERARRNLWEFCKLLEPDFYKDSRQYLKDICDRLQAFYEDSDKEFLILSIPPQHGKSRTLKNFEAWVIGKQRDIRFFSISYNADYATDASKNLLSMVRQEVDDKKEYVYSDIFPNIRLKHGEGAINRWAVEGGFNTWLSASPNTGITGRSANIVVVDDIVKDHKTALNKRELTQQWQWFSNTLFSRRGDNKRKIIIVMTRWSKDDLAGKVLKTFPDDNFNIIYKAYDEKTGNMLCDDILNRESYKKLLITAMPEFIEANYNQTPVDIKGKLYTSFNTYKAGSDGKIFIIGNDGKPIYPKIRRTASVTDTADEGADFLCSIVFDEDYAGNAYVRDIYYTKDPVEVTIPQVAALWKKHKVYNAIVESNNGGKLYALSVKKELNEKLSYFPTVKWFHQTENKKARIITAAGEVMRRVYFPEGWERLFPEFFQDMDEYQKDGIMEHDDAEDTTTMIVEYLDGKLLRK